MLLKIGIRIIMTLLFLGLLILFIIPIGAGIINVGNIIGGAVSGLLMVISLFPGAFAAVARRLWEHTGGRVFLCAFGGITAVCAVTALAVSIAMLAAMSDKPKGNDTTLVVLGCQVRGTEPSLMLARRLNTACEYMSAHEDVCAVVSGGQGDDEITTEADVMKAYLVRKGISPERIFMEDRSTNTLENIRFSKEIIEAEGLCADITIVTDGYHQLRADMFAKREGLRSYNIAAPTAYWLLPTYWVREWFGVVYYKFFG